MKNNIKKINPKISAWYDCEKCPGQLYVEKSNTPNGNNMIVTCDCGWVNRNAHFLPFELTAPTTTGEG